MQALLITPLSSLSMHSSIIIIIIIINTNPPLVYPKASMYALHHGAKFRRRFRSGNSGSMCYQTIEATNHCIHLDTRLRHWDIGIVHRTPMGLECNSLFVGTWIPTTSQGWQTNNKQWVNKRNEVACGRMRSSIWWYAYMMTNVKHRFTYAVGFLLI